MLKYLKLSVVQKGKLDLWQESVEQPAAAMVSQTGLIETQISVKTQTGLTKTQTCIKNTNRCLDRWLTHTTTQVVDNPDKWLRLQTGG